MTVQSSCGDNSVWHWMIQEKERQLVEAFQAQFAYWPKVRTNVRDEILREIARVSERLPKFHPLEITPLSDARALLLSAAEVVEKEEHEPMTKLLAALRSTNF